MLRRIIWWWKILKQYLTNCSIHGFKYLVGEEYSYIERVFWLIFCILSWWGCSIMVAGVIREYTEHPVVVTAETMYLNWKTPFPTIGFCVTTSLNIRNKYFKQHPGLLDLYAKKDASVTELLAAYEELKHPCTEFLGICSWNGEIFNCCDEFQEVPKAGSGHCYVFNNYHLTRSGKPLNFYVNRTVKTADLVIDIIANASTKHYFPRIATYILNNYQLPAITISEEAKMTKLKQGHITRIDFSIKDIYNDEGVRSVSIERRNCRFSNEVTKNSFYSIYNADSCIVEVYIQRMIKFCGCVNFYYPVAPGVRTCNVTEMRCIANHKPNITSKEISRETCYPDCEGIVIEMQYFDPVKENGPPSDIARVHIKLLSHPTSRYRRYVVFSLLDVVVSVGSAIGLFMGGSILSFFEIPYWLFIRRDRIT